MNIAIQYNKAITLTALFFMSFVVQAATTDIANTPLSQAGANGVKPNLMFVLDDSGSMGSNYTPDNVVASNQCRLSINPNNSNNTSCTDGEPPFYSAQYNSAYYDPKIRYEPAVNPCDPSSNLPEMDSLNTNGWTAVRTNGLSITATCALNSGTANILSTYPEMVFCNSANPGGGSTSTVNCRRNGINQLVAGAAGAGGNAYTAAQVIGDYDFPDNVSSNATPTPWYTNGAPYVAGTFRFQFTNNNSNPHYYTITPREYCTDSTLVTCTLSSVPTGAFVVPAYYRYCRSTAFASDTGLVTNPAGTTVTGNAANCNSKYIGSYGFARYGTFTRTDIVPTTATYPKSLSRTDCLGASCTYAEEMTNFANWYAYYRTRMQFMKSSAGHAFNTINDAYRVGFITINPGNPVSASKYLALGNFDAAQKTDWYKKFYLQGPTGGTPLREALSRIGKYYSLGTVAGMPTDPQPEKYSCQQNFTLLTTDGYWTSVGSPGFKQDDSAIGNEDGVESEYIKRSEGSLDGLGASSTLADIAAYYYKGDLRPDIDDNDQIIAALNTKDPNPKQHMTTFTLGLGLDGTLTYRSDYESTSATTGDFADIKAGTKNWPIPTQNTPTALDDLWHAAVNGHGTYFSAKNPDQLNSGIQGALAGIAERQAGGGAASVSAPNITATDNFRFSTLYKTREWSGDLIAKTIDPLTNVVSAPLWSGQAKLDAGPGRPVYFFDKAVGRKDFLFNQLSAIEQTYFANICTTAVLTQCPQLTVGAKALANDGPTFISFLRGDQSNEGDKFNFDKAFRDRVHILGDIVAGGATLVRKPRFNYTDAGYDAFKNISRTPAVYTAANDGMLHAFNANDGTPLWSFVPKSVMSKMHRLADKTYDNNHQFFIDAKPTISDMFVGGSWKTILVGGFGAGARGYYAIDVTNPNNPLPMWEICGVTQPVAVAERVCSSYVPNMGFTYGNPVFFKKPSGAWTIAVTSGYNNVSPGDGQGHLYFLDPATGAIQNDYATGIGSTAVSGFCTVAPCPSGLGKIGAFAKDAIRDATVTKMYVGDLFGNLHRLNLETNVFDIMATLSGPNGPQPITTKPLTGKVKNVNEPIVFVGTGKFIGTNDIIDSSVQSLYAMRDKVTSSYGNPRSTLAARYLARDGNSVTISSSGPVDWVSGGWYVDLTAIDNERVNIDPILALGTLIVGTNGPKDQPCSAGGSSVIYQFSFATGLPPDNGSVIGDINDDSLLAGLAAYVDGNGQLQIDGELVNGNRVRLEGKQSVNSSNGIRAGYHEITKSY